MPFITKIKSCKGTAEKGAIQEQAIVVTLEKPPLDMKTGALITTVCYSHDEQGMEEAITDIGPGNVRRILQDNEKVECTVDVEYHDWEKGGA